jgi:hypothetical protein
LWHNCYTKPRPLTIWDNYGTRLLVSWSSPEYWSIVEFEGVEEQTITIHKSIMSFMYDCMTGNQYEARSHDLPF